MLTRRTFLQTTAIAALAAPADQPKRIALLANSYGPRSRAQQMGDRFLVGYPYAGAWHAPNFKLASLYVQQKSEGDLSAQRAAEFGIKVAPTAAEAVRGANAVLVFGEPELLEQCVKAFDQEGRAVPVYKDGTVTQALVDASRRLKFPLLAGSPIPVTFRLPAIELPTECELEDALVVSGGGSDDAHFFALEALQCMVERRAGGETGVKAVQVLEGDAVWKAAAEGRYPDDLLTAALSRSDTPLGLTVQDGRTQDLAGSGQLPKLVKNPVAYFIEYRSGLNAAALILEGAIQDLNFAAHVKEVRQPQSTQFLLTPQPNATYSAGLAAKIEQMFDSGVAPYPVERALLTSGILETGLKSKGQGHARLETPHLAVEYKPPAAPQFARG